MIGLRHYPYSLAFFQRNMVPLVSNIKKIDEFWCTAKECASLHRVLSVCREILSAVVEQIINQMMH